MDQVEQCLERAAFTEAVAQRLSVVEQKTLLLEIAAQWRRMAEAAKAKSALRPTCQPDLTKPPAEE